MLRLAAGYLVILALAGAIAACGGGTAHRTATAAPPTFAPTPVPMASPSAAPGIASPAFSATTLPVSGFGRIVVDAATGHVFVSSPKSSAIVVLDLDGNIVQTITGEAGADAMVIKGSVLYVTLTTAGAIDEISTISLSRTKTLITGLVNPADLAMAGGLLWTTTGRCALWSTKLVSVDTATGATHTYAPPANSSLAYCAAFATSSSQPNLIVAWGYGLSPATITRIEISSTGRPSFKQNATEMVLGNLSDVAITRDGAHFITASGAPYEFDEWNLNSLAQDGVIYPAGAYPVAVAVSNGGRHLVVGGLDAPYGQAIYEYPVGNPASTLYGHNFASTTNVLYRRSVDFSPDESSIFAVSGDQDIGQVTVLFNVLRTAG
jgi:hypothetical protein